MKDNYVFEYLNENDFKIKERTIRTDIVRMVLSY